MREIILDTETTGLDPNRGDRVVEIGCVEIVDRFITGKIFHCYINPERLMPHAAFAVHGISDEFLADKPVFSKIVDEFIEFIGDDKIIAHNASFDVNFLNAELKRCGNPSLILSDRVVDTLSIARKLHPNQSNSLDALCNRYNIDISKRTKHGALLDAEILAELYIELTGGKQTALSLNQNDSPKIQSIEEEYRQVSYEKISLISIEEIEKHKVFIAEIGSNSLWNLYL